MAVIENVCSWRGYQYQHLTLLMQGPEQLNPRGSALSGYQQYFLLATLPPMPLSRAIFSPAVHSFKPRPCLSLVVPNLCGRNYYFPKSILDRRACPMSTSRVNTESYVGQSGRHYKIERILQKETDPPRQVCLAV